MARPEGFEPPTPWSEARCSNPLSYGRHRQHSQYTSGMYVAIDVGGTSARAMSFRSPRSTKPVKSGHFRISRRYDQDMTDLLALVKKIDPSPDGIGLAIAGVADEDRGTITGSGNLADWHGRAIRDDLEKGLSCQTRMANDGFCAALGEAYQGHGRSGDFWFMIWGTGVGGSYVTHRSGQPEVFPSELGHHVTNPAGPLCPCGQTGCLEAHIGGSAIERKYGTPAASLAERSWAEVLQQAAVGIANACALLPTEQVILGGGVAIKQRRRLDTLSQLVRQELRIVSPPDLKISQLEFDAGLYGALNLLRD